MSASAISSISFYPVGSIFVIGLALSAVIAIVYKSWSNGISPMPTSAAVRRAVVSELKRVPPPGLLVEAGSGWGTLALQLAANGKGWRIIGIENSWIPLGVSKLAARLNRSADLTFAHGDIYRYRYDKADVVVCYLFPGAMTKLSSILREQLKPGARIISVCFALPGWEPERVMICADMYRTKLYVYETKL